MMDADAVAGVLAQVLAVVSSRELFLPDPDPFRAPVENRPCERLLRVVCVER
jgi:hypothetical protein